MMIDSVVWAQYINVTDTQPLSVTHSHVAIANAALRTLASSGRNIIVKLQCPLILRPCSTTCHHSVLSAAILLSVYRSLLHHSIFFYAILCYLISPLFQTPPVAPTPIPSCRSNAVGRSKENSHPGICFFTTRLLQLTVAWCYWQLGSTSSSCPKCCRARRYWHSPVRAYHASIETTPLAASAAAHWI